MRHARALKLPRRFIHIVRARGRLLLQEAAQPLAVGRRSAAVARWCV
jgi:hypothetical protein